MLRKFDYKTDKDLLENLPFQYETTLPNIINSSYVLIKNGMKELVEQDVLYSNDFPYLFLPRKKFLWEMSTMLWITNEDIKKLEKEVEITIKNPIGYSYIYKTEEIIKMEGKKMSNFRRHVNQFKNKYAYKIFDKYDTEKIFEFLIRWDKQQKIKTYSYNVSLENFVFNIKNTDNLNIKNIFVEINEKLAGIAQGIVFDKNKWVGLHLKVDYKYKGLSRFLFRERAKLFKNYAKFTTGCGDEGIIKYKESLHPEEKIEYFYIMTGKNKHRQNGSA